MTTLSGTNWDSENIYRYSNDTDDIIGKWLKRTGKRNEIFLATKFGFMEMMDPIKVRIDPETMFAGCESSLKRLRTN